ncbi:MAG: DeoR/GlpR transcriptional regulator [Clostridia bacterium]|nr:DeoR/GlpR transcriptional regulator [Clostridia bacterium]
MYQEERLNQILALLQAHRYATVDFLVSEIRYSAASIRRDLAILEKRGLVKRSYGGVTLNAESDTPFLFRQQTMKPEKNLIAKEAAKLVSDGDVIFLDGSSTAQYMGPFLLKKRDIAVITNNLTLATYLAENGVEVYCAGGRVTELPGTTAGSITAKTFASFRADIMFFSTDAMDSEGVISVKPESYFIHNTAMLEHSAKHVYLCSSNKIGTHAKIVQCDLSEVDYFISDATLPASLRKKFPKTKFITAKREKE